MAIRPVGVQLFHADGQTHTTKLIVAFRRFANSPKNDENTEFCRMVTDFSSVLKINIDEEASKPSTSVRTNAKVIIVQELHFTCLNLTVQQCESTSFCISYKYSFFLFSFLSYSDLFLPTHYR